MLNKHLNNSIVLVLLSCDGSHKNHKTIQAAQIYLKNELTNSE